MLNHLAFGSGAARNLPARGYYAGLRRDVKSSSTINIPKSTLAALIVAIIAILVVVAVSLWLVLRYTCTRDGRKRGMRVTDDRDAFKKEQETQEGGVKKNAAESTELAERVQEVQTA